MSTTIQSTNRLLRLGILQEPMGYADGANLYQFVNDNPLKFVDPLGTDGTQPTPATPASQPAVSPEQREYDALLKAAQAWNASSPPWSLKNQCFDQSVALMTYLQSLKPIYWNITTEGGWTGTPKVGYHHVTLLTPKKTNPLPPMVFDAFKGPGNSTAAVGTESGDAFRQDYPLDCGCCKNHPIPPEDFWTWLARKLSGTIPPGY